MKNVAETLAKTEFFMSSRSIAGNMIQLGDEHGHQEEGQRPASHVGDLGIGLEQIAQSGQAQGHARCGDGYFFDNVAHGTYLS